MFNITKKLNGKTYLSADGSEVFFRENNPFIKSEIKLVYHNYNHPIYKQNTKKFIKFCSVVDLLFNEGINAKNFFKK